MTLDAKKVYERLRQAGYFADAVVLKIYPDQTGFWYFCTLTADQGLAALESARKGWQNTGLATRADDYVWLWGHDINDQITAADGELRDMEASGELGASIVLFLDPNGVVVGSILAQSIEVAISNVGYVISYLRAQIGEENSGSEQRG